MKKRYHNWQGGDYMINLNKTYTWEEITKAFPDTWVIITDIKEKNGEIKTCKLLDVCSADERAVYVKKYINSGKKFKCERTTFRGPNVGILS